MTYDKTRLLFALAKYRVDVLFCEYLQVAVSILDVAQRLGIRVIGHAHGYDVSAQPRQACWSELYGTQLPKLAAIVAVSATMKETLIKLGAPAHLIEVIPCGVSVANSSSRRRDCPMRVISVGRLVGKKGPIFVLESFRQIQRELPDAELCVVGDGPYLPAMRQFVRACELKRVTFYGSLGSEDVHRLMADSAILLQHSVEDDDGDMEGLPVVVLEAMAAGVPVVATRHAGIPEAIVDSVSGFLVEPGDCRGMAARAVTLLRSPEARERICASRPGCCSRAFLN